MSPGTEKLLLEEAWRSERAINVYRSILFTGVCGAAAVAIIAGSSSAGTLRSADKLMLVVLSLGLLYGVACGVLGLTWLKRRYNRAVPYVMTTLDVGALIVIAASAQRVLMNNLDPRSEWQLYTTTASFMLLLSTNALRFSWKVSAYSTAIAALGFVWLLRIHGMKYSDTLAVSVIHMLAFGAILAYTTVKLRAIIHRVKERDALARFLPAPLVEELERDPSAVQLGGQKQFATVLFSDIRNFTKLSEKMDPTEVVSMLNEYFEQMVAEIDARGGFVDKFIGDGICAVFGPPLSERDGAKSAIECACGMLKRLGMINDKRKARGHAELVIGIGIHAGSLVVGRIGTPQRLEYTHIGDTVNTASRIEALTKTLGVPLLVSKEAQERAGQLDVRLEDLGSHDLRGRQPITVFGLGAAGTKEDR